MLRKSSGFTLIESVVVLALAAVALSIAVPSWHSVTERRQLTSSTEQVTALLATAQSEAIRLNSPISVSFSRSDDTNWCVGAVLGDTGCDCTVTDAGDGNYCIVDGVERRQAATFLKDLHLTSATDLAPGSGDSKVVFDPVTGILSPAGDLLNFEFASSTDAYQLRVQIGPTGNMRVCNPDPDTRVTGYPACLD